MIGNSLNEGKEEREENTTSGEGSSQQSLSSQPKPWYTKVSNIMLLVIAVLAITAVGVSIWLAMTEQTLSIGGGSSETEDDDGGSVEVTQRDTDGIPPAEEGKVEATEKAGQILEMAHMDFESEEEVIEYSEEIAQGNNLDELDQDLVDSVRIVDLLSEEEDATLMTYQLLIMLSVIVSEVAEVSESEPFIPLWSDEEVRNNVVYDADIGIAYVPVSAFAGNQAALTMEMAWVDGEWMLMPYSLIEGVSMSSGAGGGSELSDDEIAELEDLDPQVQE